jgi:xanthine/CO dehydrogenase XdhC/CoxF family maturation factor
MHLGTPALLEFFRSHCEEDWLVLATIIATEGSTYRKPGAMMLISQDGTFEGLISGGCLEGDLLLRAAEVFASGTPARVTYDMHADDDLVWGLGLGCDGVIHLLLQRLEKGSQFGCLEQLEASHRSRNAALLALVTQSDGSVPVGAHGFIDTSGVSDGTPDLIDLLRDMSGAWPDWRSRIIRWSDNRAGESIVVHIPVTPRVLICGAGPDAVPLVGALTQLGWDIVVADHRPAFARADRFAPGCTILQARPQRLGDAFDLMTLDAAVIMSHNLEHDSAYLGCLAALDLSYIGVLGPQARRRRLADMTGFSWHKLYGPVGLDIGAELPASIALAVAAEIHAVLNGRSGGSLTEGGE